LITHDPQKITEELRNHLASHDRSFCFLFGAGASSSINVAPIPKAGAKRQYIPLIPSIAPLTQICKEAASSLGENFSKAWKLLENQCETSKKDVNIENILSLVRSKIDAIGPGEKLLNLEKKDIEKLETNIRNTIAKSVSPKEERIPKEIPHYLFAAWMKRANRNQPIEIFTTNYDLLIERALDYEQIPYFDGFVGSFEPFFYADCLEDEDYLPPKKWVRVWKIHGSVNWKIKTINKRNTIIRKDITESGEMILPSHRKYDESRKQPYTALIDRLSMSLNKDHSLLITCGYSFGDQHINSVIFSALETRATANVVSLQFEDLKQEEALVRHAVEKNNLTVLGPNAGVIGSTWGEWKFVKPVDEKTCSFMDVVFDSNAAPEVADEALRGRLKLGDFNWFCKFLLTMERRTEE
jgi:hypothetical protein